VLVPSAWGTSRTFLDVSARSIAFSAAATASDLIAAWPVITTLGKRRRPSPDTVLDALNDGIFDVPIFHHEPRFRGKRLTRRMGSLEQVFENVAGTTAKKSD
jgi:hypothetical protein